MVAAGGVIGAETGKGSRSLASSGVDDVAEVDDEFLGDGDGDGDVGSSRMGRRASSSTASEFSGMD